MEYCALRWQLGTRIRMWHDHERVAASHVTLDHAFDPVVAHPAAASPSGRAVRWADCAPARRALLHAELIRRVVELELEEEAAEESRRSACIVM